jgi:hypothetical protein
LISHFWPAKETLIPASIYEDVDNVSSEEYKGDGVGTPEVGTGSDAGDEKEARSAKYAV